jgi:hypothetical protein
LLCQDATGGFCSGGIQTGFQQLYVVHKFAVGSTGSTFTIDISQAPGTTLLGFTSAFVAYSGDPATGVTVDYGTCMSGSINIGFEYMVVACGQLDIRPAFSQFCTGQLKDAAQPYGLCACIGTRECFPLPTEPSTWGSVKALYR